MHHRTDQSESQGPLSFRQVLYDHDLMMIAWFGQALTALIHFSTRSEGTSPEMAIAFLLPSWNRKTSGQIFTQTPMVPHFTWSTATFMVIPPCCILPESLYGTRDHAFSLRFSSSLIFLRARASACRRSLSSPSTIRGGTSFGLPCSSRATRVR
jgi:hypothetical protein